MSRARSLLLIDPLLLLAALGLVACSLVTLKVATRSSGLHYVDRQAIYAGMGLLAALLITQFDYTRLREYRYVLYGLMIALNVVVLGMPAIQNAHRWIPLPFFQVHTCVDRLAVDVMETGGARGHLERDQRAGNKSKRRE